MLVNDVVTETVKYYYAGGSRIAMRRTPAGGTSALSYIFADHLGSTSVVSSTVSSQISRASYYPFGGQRANTGGPQTDRLFTGQRLDGTGLYDYQARHYDPYLNRWIQPDSIVPQPGNPQDLNRYSYARNNPLNYTDPTGHDPVSDWLVDIGKSGPAGRALVMDMAALVHRINRDRDLILFPNESISWQDRAVASTEIGGGAVLVTAATVKVGFVTWAAAMKLAAPTVSIWRLDPLERGRAIEERLGANTGWNFPVIDRWVNGIATSIKSIDLTAKTYQNIDKLSQTVQGYIDKVANYQGQAQPWGGLQILPNQIVGRSLELVIPKGGYTQAQMNALLELQRYAQTVNVTVKIIEME